MGWKQIVSASVAAVMLATLGMPAGYAAPKSEVVYESVRSGPMNSFFEWGPVGFPMIGQSVTIEAPVRVSEVRFFPDELSRWKKIEYIARNQKGEYDQSWIQSKFSGKVPVDSTLEIWRYTGQGSIPDNFDTSVEFESVYRATSGKDISLGKPYSIPVKPEVVLQPGTYFVSLGMESPDKNIAALRFWGQQNGKNRRGGYDHDVPNPKCKYKPTKDSTPGDRAFKLDARDRPAVGPPPGTVGFGTTFMEQDTKVTECAVPGLYGDEEMVWNPGDLQLEILGRKVRKTQ